MYLEKKGQISVEFLFITFIFLIIIIGMLTLVNEGIDKTPTGDLAKARVVGEKFASAINAVHVEGNGYSANFTIEGSRLKPGTTFTVNDATDTVDVTCNGETIKIQLVAKHLTNFNTISSSTDTVVTITNKNGTIEFT